MPGFAHDIRPMFRDKDIEEMRFAFDLNQFDDVRANAASILERVSDGTMPCDVPWTSDQIDLFRRWMDEGYSV